MFEKLFKGNFTPRGCTRRLMILGAITKPNTTFYRFLTTILLEIANCERQFASVTSDLITIGSQWNAERMPVQENIISELFNFHFPAGITWHSTPINQAV